MGEPTTSDSKNRHPLPKWPGQKEGGHWAKPGASRTRSQQAEVWRREGASLAGDEGRQVEAAQIAERKPV